jgi:hypothetical protein
MFRADHREPAGRLARRVDAGAEGLDYSDLIDIPETRRRVRKPGPALRRCGGSTHQDPPYGDALPHVWLVRLKPDTTLASCYVGLVLRD